MTGSSRLNGLGSIYMGGAVSAKGISVPSGAGAGVSSAVLAYAAKAWGSYSYNYALSISRPRYPAAELCR